VKWNSVGVNEFSRTAVQIAVQFERIFPGARLRIFGFSLGAAIAFKVSQTTEAEQIILCSMSPLFAEDVDLQKFSFRQLSGLLLDRKANGLSMAGCSGNGITLLYGELDSGLINKNIIERRRVILDGSAAFIVSNARHDISGQAYLAAIKAQITAHALKRESLP